MFNSGKDRYFAEPTARQTNWCMALLLRCHLSSRRSGKTTHSKIMMEESRAITFSGGAKWKSLRHLELSQNKIQCIAINLNPLNWEERGQQSAIAYRRSEGEKQPGERSAPGIAVTQAKRKFPGMTGEMRSHHNEVLNHSPKPAAQCLPFHGRIFLPKGFLSNHAQDVVGHHSQFQSQRVRLELSGREAFEIHVAFQFAVKLLRFPVSVIEGDKGAVGKGEVCPEHVDFHVRNQKNLSVFVYCTLRNFIDSPQSARLFSVMGIPYGRFFPC